MKGEDMAVKGNTKREGLDKGKADGGVTEWWRRGEGSKEEERKGK